MTKGKQDFNLLDVMYDFIIMYQILQYEQCLATISRRKARCTSSTANKIMFYEVKDEILKVGRFR